MKLAGQVDDSGHGTPDVDDAGDIVRNVGEGSDVSRGDNFLHIKNGSGVLLSS